MTERERGREDDGRGTSWMLEARCRGLSPEIFFPNDGAGVEVARRYCAECHVKDACLTYALDNHIDHGIWGGESERARRRIARSRRKWGSTSEASDRNDERTSSADISPGPSSTILVWRPSGRRPASNG
ncbi:MAG TPA: WhiB family transcriptional regulator [Acidimicrobiales bacterium]|nr:WhiB family transcriptional regulator [Acidimicrobiales bacterium]